MFWSQYGQDEFIYSSYFSGGGVGFFFEAGMVEGERLSNTLFFERSLGWNGLCVEPNPAFHDRIRAVRKADLEPSALGTVDQEMLFLCAGDLGGILRYLDTNHIKRCEELYSTASHLKKENLGVRWIRARPIMDILGERGIDRIDYFSLDIEGGEYQILETIDYSKVHINSMTVKSQYGGDQKIKALLEGNGLQFVRRMEADLIFVNRNFIPLKA